MPTIGDMSQFLRGNAFGKNPPLPSTDLAGKTIIVTGANSGLGLDACKHIARLQVSRLILACRSVSKGETAKAEIEKDTNCGKSTEFEVWEVDLDYYDSVFNFCERVKTDLARLDGFIANAGLELVDFELSEGVERHLTVNVISTFLMGLEVLPKLQETNERFKVATHLSFVGSCIHIMAPINQLTSITDGKDVFDALSDPNTAQLSTRYPLSKLVGHFVFNAVLEHLPQSCRTNESGVIINLVNPGWCESNLARAKGPEGVGTRIPAALFRRTQEAGSRTLVHAVTAGWETHGRYLSECKVVEQSAFVRSAEGRKIQELVWDGFVRRVQQVDNKALERVGL